MSNYLDQIDWYIQKVSTFYGVTKSDLSSSNREANLTLARHVLCYCLRVGLKLSFPAIGTLLKRDHTSILHGYNRISTLLPTDKELKIFVDIIINNSINNNSETDSFLNNQIDNEPIANRTYVIKKYKLETDEYIKSFEEALLKKDAIILKAKKDYENLFKEALLKKDAIILKAKEDYKSLSQALQNERKIKLQEYKEALNLLKRGKFIEVEKYLNPKKELLNTENIRDDLDKFLPKYRLDVKNYDLPIQFNQDFIEEVFNNLDIRTKNILINRYGLKNNESTTLEAISNVEGISGERIRQLIKSGLKKLYTNNCNGIRQIINNLAEQIIKEDIIPIDDIINKFFICTQEHIEQVKKFILIIIMNVAWIKLFDFSGNTFLINYYDEKIIFKYIDDVKNIIERIDKSMPDLVENKWLYILENLKLYEYFKNKPVLLKEKFLRSCYDNYLFESNITVYKRDMIKKYDIQKDNDEIINGVPNKYNTFFK